MAKYKKADNCGPVPYPDQSGRYLGEGEVAEDDAANDWAPLLPLGFVVLTESDVTEDKQESPEELAAAVKVSPPKPPPPLPPTETVGEMARFAASKPGVKENAGETMARVPTMTESAKKVVTESKKKVVTKYKKKNGKKKGTKSSDVSGD